MFNSYKDYVYKLSKDTIWEIGKYIALLFFGSRGYLMSDWVGALLLGLGSFFVISYIKYLFDKLNIKFEEQNKIEGKLLINDQFLISPTANQDFLITLFLHNCSNQIIYIEVDAQNTKGSIETATHSSFSTNLKSVIPPYAKVDLRLPSISVGALENKKELTLSIVITIKYGNFTKPLNLEIKKNLTTKFLKQEDKDKQITYTPIIS